MAGASIYCGHISRFTEISDGAFIEKGNQRLLERSWLSTKMPIMPTEAIIIYEGESISNAYPISGGLRRSRFSCFVSVYALYMGTKLLTYRVIL